MLLFHAPVKTDPINPLNIAFNHKLQKELDQECDPKEVSIIGFALGNDCQYLDFIAWDSKKVIEVGKEFFKQNPVEVSGFRTLHTEAHTLFWSM